MDTQDLRTLQLLEEIDQAKSPSQRDLAQKLNISLGLVNSFVKRLAHRGYFKITTIPRNRVKYILTPEGLAEKTRLTYEYIQHSLVVYKRARRRISALLKKFEQEGVTSIVIYGANDLAEIAYISLHESTIRLTAVVDDKKLGRLFLGFEVADPRTLERLKFDRIIVTAIKSRKQILHRLLAGGIAAEKIEIASQPPSTMS